MVRCYPLLPSRYSSADVHVSWRGQIVAGDEACFEATSPLVSLPIPAGKFVVTAVVNFTSSGVGVNEATCYLSTDNGATSVTQASDTVPEGPNGGSIHGYSQITLTSAVSLPSSATLGVLCVGEGTSTTATGAIRAVQVSQLN